jgi:glycerophosphoryl diester phosphodiesterase
MSRWQRGAATALAATVALSGLAAITTGPASAAPAKTFDLQAHRGGLGLRVENTLASFGNALQLGVSTLELDVQITQDGQAVVTHEYLRQDPSYYFGPDVPVLQRRDKLKVVPYTVDDPALMQRVIDLGVDGIITDNPRLLIQVAIRNGLR